MPRPTSPSEYSTFLGLNEEPGSQIGEQQASVLQNLYLWGDGKQLVRRKGTYRLTEPGIDAFQAFDGLHYARVNGTDYLMGVQEGSIGEWINGGRGDVVSGGANRFTTGRRTGAAFLPQALYIGDGLNPNVRWD